MLARDFLLLAQRPLNVALRIAFGGGFALVVLLLPFAKTDQQLRVAVADINLERHDRISLLLGLAQQLVNLRLMQQQLARAGRIDRVEPVALLERADVHIVDEHFPVSDRSESVVNIRLAHPNRFNFRSCQYHARFERFLNEIVMGSFLILSELLAVTLLTHALTPSSSKFFAEWAFVSYLSLGQQWKDRIRH